LGIKSCKAIIAILLLLLVAQFTLATKDTMARQSKDIILVLDTSMSMIGRAGGKDILEKVKRSINDYIDQVGDGDRVTFVTFESDVKIYPTVLVDDDNDRDIIKKYISMTEATGLWTYTHKMIMKVFDEAEKLHRRWLKGCYPLRIQNCDRVVCQHARDQVHHFRIASGAGPDENSCDARVGNNCG